MEARGQKGKGAGNERNSFFSPSCHLAILPFSLPSAGIGDAVLAVLAMKVIREFYPKAYVAFTSRKVYMRKPKWVENV